MKHILFFLLAAYMSIFLTGCSDNLTHVSSSTNSEQNTASPPPKQQDPVKQPAQTNSQVQAKPNTVQENKVKVKAYFTDVQATDLIEREQEIQWDAQKNKYAAAFAALSKSPEQKIEPLWANQQAQIQLHDGLLTVNLMNKSEFGTGSTVERLMVLSLLKTMFQFPEVKKVQLLVGGKAVESLSGHVEIEKPFTREMMADL